MAIRTIQNLPGGSWIVRLIEFNPTGLSTSDETIEDFYYKNALLEIEDPRIPSLKQPIWLPCRQ